MPTRWKASLSTVKWCDIVLVSPQWQSYFCTLNYKVVFSIHSLLKMYYLFKRRDINKVICCGSDSSDVWSYLLSWTSVFKFFQVLGTTTLQSSSVSTPTSSCKGSTGYIIHLYCVQKTPTHKQNTHRCHEAWSFWKVGFMSLFHSPGTPFCS